MLCRPTHPHSFESANTNDASPREAANRHATRVLVTNVVPFHLENGLPAEVTPILFDSIIDASVLAGGIEKPPPGESRSGGKGGDEGRDPKTKRGTEKQVAGAGKHARGRGEDREGLWMRRMDPLAGGEILSYVHCASDGNSVEVRIRGAPLKSYELANVRLQADLSKLVVEGDGEREKAV